MVSLAVKPLACVAGSVVGAQRKKFVSVKAAKASGAAVEASGAAVRVWSGRVCLSGWVCLSDPPAPECTARFRGCTARFRVFAAYKCFTSHANKTAGYETTRQQLVVPFHF